MATATATASRNGRAATLNRVDRITDEIGALLRRGFELHDYLEVWKHDSAARQDRVKELKRTMDAIERLQALRRELEAAAMA
jgi:hypothetical protein